MYCDLEESIKEFFRHSINRTLDDFNFEEVFEYCSMVINQKLDEHGLNSFDAFKANFEDIYSNPDLSNYCIETNYISFCEDELTDVLIEYIYAKNRKTFSEYGSFKELQRLIVEMDNSNNLTTSEKAILFDAVIHAQHETGDIFEDIDIEQIKAEIDKEYE